MSGRPLLLLAENLHHVTVVVEARKPVGDAHLAHILDALDPFDCQGGVDGEKGE